MGLLFFCFSKTKQGYLPVGRNRRAEVEIISTAYFLKNLKLCVNQTTSLSSTNTKQTE